MIDIKPQNDNTFTVTVSHGRATTHEVTLDDAYHKKLTQGNVDKESLIRQSFEFLLERESNSSILRSFDLPTIQRYFPEYESTIKEWAGAR